MSSGDIWNLMPYDFQSKVKTVTKLTNNVDGKTKDAAVSATSDRLFLISYSEMAPASWRPPYWTDYPWTSSEGTQYEGCKGKVTENRSATWWARTAMPSSSDSRCFLFFLRNGNPSFYSLDNAASLNSVCPAWCF